MNTIEQKMTKLTLPDVDGMKIHTLKQLVISLLQMRDVYVSERDIELSSYKSWDFYKLSVYRWSDAGAGCGSRASRDTRWDLLQQEIKELFEQNTGDHHSWRWLPHNGYDMNTPYDKVVENNENYIVGRTFYIKKGPLILSESLFSEDGFDPVIV